MGKEAIENPLVKEHTKASERSNEIIKELSQLAPGKDEERRKTLISELDVQEGIRQVVIGIATK